MLCLLLMTGMTRQPGPMLYRHQTSCSEYCIDYTTIPLDFILLFVVLCSFLVHSLHIVLHSLALAVLVLLLC